MEEQTESLIEIKEPTVQAGTALSHSEIMQ